MASLTTLNELIQAKDAATVKAELITLLAKYGFDATDWESGSESRTMLELESKSLEELWTVVSNIAKGMHLDTATNGWLTLLAKSQYQLDRIPEEYTRGVATFTLVPGGGPRTITAGSVIISDGLGHDFITDNALAVVLNNANPSGQVEIISQKTGYENNVAAGTLTQVVQGPADVTVTNLGIPLAATVVGTGLAPFNVNGLTLQFQDIVDGVTSSIKTVTFGANYANIGLLVTALNGNATFNTNLIASNNGAGRLKIDTKKKGANQGIIIKAAGTANLILGFSNISDTTAVGGTSVDQAASIYSAYLAGPFNLNTTTLIITVTEDGIVKTPTTVTFPANYNTMDLLVAGIQPLVAPLKLIATNDSGRLKLETVKKGPAQSISLSPLGTANLLLGFSSTLATVSTGRSAWITQEGRDEETDESLRERCKNRWGILGTGTASAFETWAREADPKVQKVVVYSNYLNGTPKAGAVTIYVAGLNSDLDAATVTAVYNYILPKIPIMSELYVGTVRIVPVYYTGILTITQAVNTPTYLNGFRSNVNAYSQSLQIKQGVLKKRIEAEIISALRPGIINLNLTLPTADVIIQNNEMAVIQEDPVNPMLIIVK